MHILYTNFHRDWGGQAQQVLLLARAMAARGHGVTVFSPRESALAERAAEEGLAVDASCRFLRGLRPASLAHDARALCRAAVQDEAQVLHAHGSQDNWTAALALMGRRARTALVRTKHNTYPVRRHAANRWLYNRANAHVIAVAGPIRDELVAGGFVSEDRVSVIHAGLDDAFAQRPRSDPQAVRTELGIPAEAPLVGLVARLAPDKGQDTLLHAAGRVRAVVPGARFLLVGTGGDWDRIRALIHSMDLENAVIWAGFRTDVASVLGALDVSVLAARDCDASSTVVKESMVLGVPVVASDIGGTAEILEHGACGRLVTPGDAQSLAQGIIDTLTDPETTARRTQRARGAVTAYLAGTIAERTESVYRTAIARVQAARG